MISCPKCNASIAEAAKRCMQCGASLTTRIGKSVPVSAAPAPVAGSQSMSGYGLILGVIAIVAVAIGVFWWFSGPKAVDVEPGIRVALPSSWREIHSQDNGVIRAHAYRGDISEKVELTLMIRKNVPADVRDKERQMEGVRKMALSGLHDDDPDPVVVDVSQGDIIHVRTDLDDTKNLNTPSAQLSSDNFKHARIGTIIRDGDFINYTITWDEQNDAYRVVAQSIEALARQ